MNSLMIIHTMDKPLPYDAEVEWLQCVPMYCVDCGLNVNNNGYSIRARVQFPTSSGYVDVFEKSRGEDETANLWFLTLAPDNQMGFNVNSTYESFDCGPSIRNTIVDVEVNSNTVTLRYNNQTVTKTVSTPASGRGTILLGNRRTNRQDGITYYYFQVYDLNNNLICDIIPVRKGNVGYLYDRISRRLLYNIKDTGSTVISPDYNPFAYQYLTFVPLEDSTFSFAKRGTGNDIEYSIDGGAWTALASEANTPTVGAGHNIRWRAELTPSTVSGSQGIGTFSATGLYDAMGNTMSLLYGDNYIGQTTLVGTYTFRQLWFNDTHIYRADRMVLPVTTLANNCYGYMFYNCTALTTAPELPATTLTIECYRGMFYGCTSLTTTPSLPATTLTNKCYRRMFAGCTRLVYVKMLATDISASNCLYDWLSDVATTGTFAKNAAMTTLPTGASGIPSGWTVIDDPSTINS